MKYCPSMGIDGLLQDAHLLQRLAPQRLGIITNQKTLTQDSIPSAYALHAKLGGALKCILTPEHGWSGGVAEGVKIADEVDTQTGLPVLSLYGKSNKFKEFMQAHPLDVLMIDLQDIGLRCYTYATTCAKFMETFVDTPFEVMVCDRPNPLGPHQQGPAFDPAWRSILSYIDVPFQHGMTMGGLLSSFNESLGDKQLPLSILSCAPFHKPYLYPWQLPSPNLPSWESVLLYPALVMLEGTNISEGRGTQFPFTSLGAPGLDHQGLADFVNNLPYTGVKAYPTTFVPKRSKFKGYECQGIRLILDPQAEFNAFEMGQHLLLFLKGNYKDFSWIPLDTSEQKSVPRAPDGHSYFIDALMGTHKFRQGLEKALPSFTP